MRLSRRVRTGYTLVELLIALPVATMVGAVTIGLLLSTVRRGQALAERLASMQQLEAARQVLLHDLRALRRMDVAVVSDSLLVWSVPRWVGVACRIPGPGHPPPELLLAPLSSNPALWPPPREPGVQLEWWERDASRITAAPTPHHMEAPPLIPGGTPAACPPLGDAARPVWRLVMGGTGAPRVATEAGFPLVFRQPVRLIHYRSGTRWWLGRSLRTEQGWSVPQPVAGPLASPASGGLRASGHDLQGRPVSDPAAMAELRLLLRAAAGDSVQLIVALPQAASGGG